jgi:hypothetical protein
MNTSEQGQCFCTKFKEFEHWIFVISWGATDSNWMLFVVRLGKRFSPLLLPLLGRFGSSSHRPGGYCSKLEQLWTLRCNAYRERRRWRRTSGCEWGGEWRRWMEPALVRETYKHQKQRSADEQTSRRVLWPSDLKCPMEWEWSRECKASCFICSSNKFL